MTQPTGYLMVDHRASPGLDEKQAIDLGYHPSQVKEGQLFEADTLRCCHCGGQYILNPLRKRERGFCFKCMEYLCDGCQAAANQPDYVHANLAKIADTTVTNAAHYNEVLLTHG
jgi:hypothetical protein